MALGTVFQNLPPALKRLRESVDAVRVHVREDEPTQGESKVAEEYGDLLEQMLDWLDEALAAADKAQAAAEYPRDMDTLRRTLAECQVQLHQVSHCLGADLKGSTRLAELMRVAKKYKGKQEGKWREWAKIIRRGLDDCEIPLHDLERAMFDCWRELAEWVGTPSVSIRATSVGQKITN